MKIPTTDAGVTPRGARPLPKVALVAASLEILGGQGVQAQALLERLGQEGYAVRLLPVNPAFPPGLRWSRRVRYLRTLINQLLYLPSLVALRQVDVVHVFSASYWSFLLAPVPALVMARLFGKRSVLHYHSGEAEDHLSRWGVLVHPWLRLADEIVVPSPYLQDVFGHHGHRVRVVRNVVDTARFGYRERVPLRPRFLSARNLEPHYRVDAVIRAFALIKARHADATLTVAGYGSQESSLRALADALGVDGIRFLGRVEPEAMPALYAETDVFLNAAVVDNQPVSLLEAFAAGVPVVTTGTGDIAAMVCHGQAGILLSGAEPRAMAEAVEALLAHPEQALRIARRAKAEVQRYTWPQISREWDEVYREAAA
jgi:glycosyltransferase involved in cell wall biosynthesis